MKNKSKSVKKEDFQGQQHVLKKSKEKSQHKQQGTPAPAKQLKSGGDSFAYAVEAIKDQALKGSKQGFLGVETQILDPKDYVTKDKLNLKGN